jgi:FkbM family methyltransferase
VGDASEYIQRSALALGTYEPAVCAVLRRLLGPGRTFLDVGANVGVHTLAAAATGARVVALEPVPRLAAHLERNVRRNRLSRRVRVLPWAASDRAGEATLYVASRADDGSHSLVPGVEAARVETLRVRTVPLDVLVAERPSWRPDVVKVDVEGNEARVLDGAAALLRSERPPYVVLETGDRLADALGESGASVLARLTRLAWRVLRIEERPSSLVEVKPGADVGPVANYLAVPPGREVPDVAQGARVSCAWLG